MTSKIKSVEYGKKEQLERIKNMKGKSPNSSDKVLKTSFFNNSNIKSGYYITVWDDKGHLAIGPWSTLDKLLMAIPKYKNIGIKILALAHKIDDKNGFVAIRR